jgi:class 3 adenylate cyclase
MSSSGSIQNGKIGKGNSGMTKKSDSKQFTTTIRDDPLPLPRPVRAASADFVRMRRHSMIPVESVVVSKEPQEHQRARRRESMPGNGNFDDCNNRKDDNNNDFDAKGNRIQKLMTKQESEAKLRSSLASLSEYNDGSEKIQRLRDRFSQSRRSLTMGSPRSLSGSRRSLVSSSRKSVGGRGQKLKGSSDTASQETNPRIPRTKSEDDMSMDQSFSTGPRLSTKSIPIKRVSRHATSRRKKYGIQREQMIESLVWFSFHTPRSVLEDLTANELELKDKQRHACRMEDVSKASGDVCISLSLSDATPDDGSLSSLSDEDLDEATAIESTRSHDGTRSESAFVQQHGMSKYIMALPRNVARDCALLFVDITGFTKLSTLLDVESLSKVINYYFDLIISEVVRHGGDVLKFAGDAFFAEWRATDNEESKRSPNDALANLNSSLAQSSRVQSGDAPSPSSRLAACVSAAAKCASEIVRKYSDFHVTSSRDVSISFGGENQSRNDAMLNVHCGIGVGHLVGLHVGDYREGREEDAVELRREYLFLGDPIEQVSIYCRQCLVLDAIPG